VTVPTVEIEAAPDRVDGAGAGGTTTVTWSGTDIDDCTVYRNGTPIATGTSGSQAVSGITGQTTFLVECSSGGVTVAATDSVIVNVVPSLEEF
jgi:hypothetical protein